MAYRVVILASVGELPRDTELVQAGVEFVYLSSPYEAAAEFLAGPADALVVNISGFKKAHLKLFTLARQQDMELFGMGNGEFPKGFSADDLSGMKLGSAGFVRENILTLAERKRAGAGSAESKVKLTSGRYESEPRTFANKEFASDHGREQN